MAGEWRTIGEGIPRCGVELADAGDYFYLEAHESIMHEPDADRRMDREIAGKVLVREPCWIIKPAYVQLLPVCF
jgi:hypothetical protein